MNYVRLTTVASVMGVTVSWLRGLVYQKVMDDEREHGLQKKGSPYIMHTQQCFQALIARRMRRRKIGYDLIREAVEGLEFDRLKYHEVHVDGGIKLVLQKAVLIMDAKAVMKQAHDLEYGTEGREAA